MATVRAMLERRRSSRVRIRIPIRISGEATTDLPPETPAEAIAVSRCGALLRVPFSPALGSRMAVLNMLSQETWEFRVVRVSDPIDGGLFDLGVEMLHPARNFWGIQLPDGQTVS